MRLAIRVLGLELVSVEASTDPEPEALEDEDGAYDVVSTPIGFAPTPGDQRWEPCADYGY
jgi:hypothetical protein